MWESHRERKQRRRRRENRGRVLVNSSLSQLSGICYIATASLLPPGRFFNRRRVLNSQLDKGGFCVVSAERAGHYNKQLCENRGMSGGAEMGSVMVKSCLINAFLYTVLTDGPGSLDEPAEKGLGRSHL